MFKRSTAKDSEYGHMMQLSAVNPAMSFMIGSTLAETISLQMVGDEADTIIREAANEEPTTDGE